MSYQSRSLLIRGKHLLSPLVGVGIVHEEEIDVLQSQLLQGVFAVGHDVPRVVLVVPELAADEELLPGKINIGRLGTLNLVVGKIKECGTPNPNRHLSRPVSSSTSLIASPTLAWFPYSEAQSR